MALTQGVTRGLYVMTGMSVGRQVSGGGDSARLHVIRRQTTGLSVGPLRINAPNGGGGVGMVQSGMEAERAVWDGGGGLGWQKG